jgi:opacity protein-like surface antigen
MKNRKLLFTLTASLIPFSIANAEPYVGLSLGYTFDAKLSGIKGNENLNYPDTIDTSSISYYPDTKYSDIKLKDVLQGGIKAGYYFDSAPSFGLEVEANYSEPKMKQQNVTITNNGSKAPSGMPIGYAITGDIISNVKDCGCERILTGDGNSVTENQLPAKVKLLQFNFNAMYRYRGFKEFTPYIGAGPSINIIRITGTGESGHFVNPTDITGYEVTAGPNISDTSVNIGANFKVGGEYHLDKDWGLGAEYHYNWSKVDITNFRSASNLNADLNMQSLSVVLTRHF